MTSSQLYGVNLAGDLKGQDFSVGTKHLALPLREFAQQIRVGCNLAPRKHGESDGISHSATNVDQRGQIPRVVLSPRGMMIREDGLELRGQFPVRHEMPTCITMIKSE